MAAAESWVAPQPPDYYLRAFAQLLKAVRVDARVSVRDLGDRCGYDHSRVVRAAGGKEMPNWPLTRAYLKGCGVSGDALNGWWVLWDATGKAERERRLRPEPRGVPEVMFWQRIDQQWREGLLALDRRDSFVQTLRSVNSQKDFGAALSALASRSGCDSLRKMAERTGCSKSSLQGWMSGQRRIDATRLDVLVEALGATPDERHEFAEALKRAVGLRCDAVHQATELRCLLGEFHKGKHRTARGDVWLDDGVLDGVIRDMWRNPGDWPHER
ncbi:MULTISPECIES: helix-turn-helix domain-containing protein [unclassified Kribbella]|uniref:helix-turn-helix domain-containing protein n=1 Tax=unclassified Kribbella TaxID=2644121 RepID=UPI00301A1D97